MTPTEKPTENQTQNQRLKKAEKKPPSRPTLRDVAREAGLSVTQTSRALNDHSDVAKQTKRRAVEAADRLGYTPNLAARRLKMPDARTQSIGLVLDTSSQRFSDPFLGDLLTAIVEEASANGFELQLSAPSGGDDVVDAYKQAIKQKRVDGFIVLRVTNDDPRLRFLVEHSIPLVTFGCIDDAHPYPVVRETDDCFQPAIDHLVELGHSSIGCIYVPLGYGISDHRLRSFHRALAAHGLEAKPEHVGGAGFHEEVGYEVANRIFASEEPPTAIMAFNDLLAFGALQAAKDHGRSVPDDMSIVGVDDVMASRFLKPALTSMRYSATEIGHHLVRQLLGALDEPTANGEVTVRPALVIRESTAPPPKPH